MSIEIILHAVQSVITLCLIVGLGAVLAAKGWFGKDSKALLPRLVTLVSLPAYMLYNITHSFNRDDLLHLAYGLIVPVGSILITYAVSLVLARATKVAPRRHGPFCVAFTASNTIFIGLPVNLALFGEVAVPYVLLYYFANTTFFWSVGNYMIASSGEAVVSGQMRKERIFSLAALKRIFAPALIGFLVGLTIVFMDVKLPAFITDTARYVGSLTTPLILISLGITFQGMRLAAMKLNRDLALVLLGRVVICPLTVVLLAHFVPLPDLMRKVFIIQASLPAISSGAVVAGYYRSDEEFATMTVLSSTLLAVITIPLFMILVSL